MKFGKIKSFINLTRILYNFSYRKKKGNGNPFFGVSHVEEK